jgi:hypothetical protein
LYVKATAGITVKFVSHACSPRPPRHAPARGSNTPPARDRGGASEVLGPPYGDSIDEAGGRAPPCAPVPHRPTFIGIGGCCFEPRRWTRERLRYVCPLRLPPLVASPAASVSHSDYRGKAEDVFNDGTPRRSRVAAAFDGRVSNEAAAPALACCAGGGTRDDSLRESRLMA